MIAAPAAPIIAPAATIIAPEAPTAAPRYLRPAAALVGALLALGSIALLYLLSGIPEVETFVRLRFVLGPGGFFMYNPLATTLTWVAPSAAAAICGWTLAPRAARGERWAGAWMGLVTYALAIVLISFLPGLQGAIDGQVQWWQIMLAGVVGGPIMVVLASAVLGPVLLSAVIAGSLWAPMLRRIAYIKVRPLDHARPIVLIVVVLSLLSSLVITLGHVPYAVR